MKARLEVCGMHGRDISEDELAKGHARYLVGGRSVVPNERIFRFGKSSLLLFAIISHIFMILEFPERPGALRAFLSGLHSALNWNITLFHYRNHGAGIPFFKNWSYRILILFYLIDLGKVLAGIQVPPDHYEQFDNFLVKLGYHYVEETESEIYKRYLKG